MDDVRDKLLEKQRSVSSGGGEYSFLTIPKRVTTIVAAYTHLIWKVKNFRKSTTPEQIIQNAKNMFENNLRTPQDDLWKEHCAASLRELVDGNLTADFPYALISLPKSTNENGEREEIYMILQVYKDTLNRVAHLNNEVALQEIKKLPSYEKVTKINNEVFDKICTDYIMSLYRLFRENCMKGD